MKKRGGDFPQMESSEDFQDSNDRNSRGSPKIIKVSGANINFLLYSPSLFFKGGGRGEVKQNDIDKTQTTLLTPS
ncbi:MAG: hypothetical protein WAT71_18340 [Ignavibacteria bacterium]